MDWAYAIAAIASSVAAILAWAAKLRWSKEYREANDRIIASKDAEINALKTAAAELRQSKQDQIDNLKEQITSFKDLNPTMLKEWSSSIAEHFELLAKALESKLRRADEEIKERERKIGELVNAGKTKKKEVVDLRREVSELKSAAHIVATTSSTYIDFLMNTTTSGKNVDFSASLFDADNLLSKYFIHDGLNIDTIYNGDLLPDNLIVSRPMEHDWAKNLKEAADPFWTLMIDDKKGGSGNDDEDGNQ